MHLVRVRARRSARRKSLGRPADLQEAEEEELRGPALAPLEEAAGASSGAGSVFGRGGERSRSCFYHPGQPT